LKLAPPPLEQRCALADFTQQLQGLRRSAAESSLACTTE
jgi:hypothetical protein